MPEGKQLWPALIVVGMVVAVPLIVIAVGWNMSRLGPEVDGAGAPSNVRRASLPENQRPIAKPIYGYAGSDSCKSCHENNHKTWHASYHRTMTQVPNPDNVVADFDGVTLQHEDRKFQLEQRDDRFWVTLDDPDWQSPNEPPPRVTREIVLMTGSHHEQDFWFESPRGRMVQRFPFVYRIEEKKWFPDTAVLMTPPDSPLGFGNWNTICIQCHSTLGRPRVWPEIGQAETDVVEFGISCEACHGPGEGHVKRHRDHKGDASKLIGKLRDEIVNPAKLDHQRSAQTCGQCHGLLQHRNQEDIARWTSHGFRFRPGKKLETDRAIVQAAKVDENPTLQKRLKQEPHFLEDRFWSDGMVRIIGREFNALIESPCYQRGKMTCLSCHSLHPGEDDPRPLKEWANDQLGVEMETNKACLQCHPSIGEDLTAHTHHAAESSGSRCYNCHMPPTTYGLLKAVHSHQINSPNLQGSLTAGRPNACNMCHLDKSLGWTNDHLAEWYKIEREDLNARQTDTPASILWALKGDAGQRALMAWAMGWQPARQASGDDWQARILAILIKDPYDAVRFIAHRSLQSAPGFKDFEYDFVRDAPRRDQFSQQALDIWNKQRQAAGKAADLGELLKTPEGETPESLLESLLKGRDDRRVQLAE